MNAQLRFSSLSFLVATLVTVFSSFSASADTPKAVDAKALQSAAPRPTQPELSTAINRGLYFLLKSQNSNGWWSTADQPAVTALVLTAFNGEPFKRYSHNNRPS